MTAELVNLRRARKAKVRSEQALEANRNRVRFGRTKAEKAKTKSEDQRAARILEGNRRESE